MDNDKILNDIAQIHRQIEPSYDSEIIDLYNSIENQQLREIFSSLHENYNIFFDIINQCIFQPYHYLNAQNSRDLLKIINLTFKLQNSLLNTEYEFNIECEETIRYCLNFLNTRGSNIPEDFQTIDIYITIPIFKLKGNIKSKQIQQYELKFIGEGSYAKVYKYKDKEYNKNFAIKRAKKNINEIELNRFKQEFDIMNKLSSPYILEVYKYNNNNNEYTMEYVENTLYGYINSHTQKLTFQQRIKLCNQIIEGFSYIHSKGYLHRDISFTNILVKEYDNDLCVIKISDFGLAKALESESNLTNSNTDIKGSLNDITNLKQIGFNNFDERFDIYAIVQVLGFILTGREKIESILKSNNANVVNFVRKGTNTNLDQRYQTIEELKSYYNRYILQMNNKEK
ncbi:protein kinase domain-containing protein [Catellicoccus marimammalium]|uniref:Putative serine/threonine protein kinase n=1 Tax=Catellicoccus marimammalium M35/04/3 TaxID=1234409 RepID=K8Z869_9ENTE|nr:protein kinase [Catellicoccus marimammalium]EKU27224.1 putative serine/threonine protein kinase [Catellicoccus marimammalium M35/04/3]